MIGEYLATGMVAVVALVGLYLLSVLPLARCGVINEYEPSGRPRHSVVASVLVWLVVLFWTVVIVLGWAITEILIPMVS